MEIDAPDFCYVDLLFSYYLCHKLLDDDELYDEVKTLPNTGRLATDDTVPIYGDMNKSGRKVSSPGNTDTNDLVTPPPDIPISCVSNTYDYSESESDSSGTDEEYMNKVK